MIVRRILFIVILLGVWAQTAYACPEALGSHEQGRAAEDVVIPVVAGDFAVIGGEQRCECPASIQSMESAVSESGRSLLVSSGADPGPVLHRASPGSMLLAMHDRAESFLARRAAQPLSLPVFRLRQ